MAAPTVFRYLNGDNKMPLDFIERILLHFPDVSAEWLMRGDGSMYNDTEREADAPAQEVQPQVVAPTTDNVALVDALREIIAAKDALIASQAELIATLKK